MQTRFSHLLICLAWAAQATVVLAQPNWEKHMDTALQAAARQDYATAEAGFSAAVRELELFNSNDPRLGPTINSLGLVYRAENKLKEAEAAFRRAYAFIEKANSPESIDVGNANLNIGSVMLSEGKYNEAEPFLQKAMRIYTKQLGDKSPKTATVMAQLGDMYRNLHDHAQAEVLLKKALDIQETARGIDDPDVGNVVNSLAELYYAQNRMNKAEPMFKLAMSIREATAGMDSSDFAAAVERYSSVLDKMGRFQEAERHKKLAMAVRSTIKKSPPPAVPRNRKEPVDMIPNVPAGLSQPAALPKNGNSVARIQ
jgi:tetratricopeptide (TPR) repeat protein